MLKIKDFFNFIIFGNILISVGAGLLTWETFLLLGLKVDFVLVAFTFFATLFTYNLDRLIIVHNYKGMKKLRQSWLYNHRQLLQILSILSAIICIVLSVHLNWQQWVFMVHLMLIAVLYALPVFGNKTNRFSLRSINGLKIFLIGYVWCASTVWLPLIPYYKHFGGVDFWLTGLERLFFIIAITIPFDIRDIEGDLQVNLKTLPALIGVTTSRILSVSLLIAFSIMCFIHYQWNLLSQSLAISAMVTAYFCVKATDSHHEYYFTGLLDGTIILQFMAVFLGTGKWY